MYFAGISVYTYAFQVKNSHVYFVGEGGLSTYQQPGLHGTCILKSGLM